MPDEPNKNMDEMLRAYAEERRKAPDVSLHPATRQMLQGEVSRVFPAPAQRVPWGKRLRAFWPQIAFAGGLCLIFGIAVLSLRQPRHSNDAITNRNAGQPVLKSSDSANEPLPAVPAPEMSSDTLAGNESGLRAVNPSGGNAENLFRNQALPKDLQSPNKASAPPLQDVKLRTFDARKQSAVQIVPTPEETEVRLQKNEVLQPAPSSQSRVRSAPSKKVNESSEAAIRESSPVVSPTAKKAAIRPASLTNLGAARRLSFVQASDPAQPPTTLSFKPAQPVLNRFQMELTGTNIRFYEEDGSVYLGAMQITNASPTLDGASASLPASRTILRDAAAYSFSVQGTNQTLGSELILTGQFFAQTNLQPSPLDSFAIAPEVKSAEPPQPSHLIIGTAVVGATNQIPVRAISNQP